ncbi:hypothetical protein RGU75_19285 [Glaciimonas sp. CA11.2]|uniref:hypothetical protein n=1 Tax=Glaciimonas sp. CA11.2 TaxID=3048601 RepID=UPI002AB53B96|nr:hypothetical protein [Glaciimonas sp. CA11.2]MDY7548361.1 hypothetical protein [Glaciimonas sp. CA11.2]
MSKPTRTRYTSPTSPESLHQPFSWLPEHHKNEEAAEFYALTKDVCQGIQTCIDLAHFSNMDRDTDTTPMLNIADTETLLRFALTSSHMLARFAELPIDKLGCRPSHNVSPAE